MIGERRGLCDLHVIEASSSSNGSIAETLQKRDFRSICVNLAGITDDYREGEEELICV